MTNLMYSIARLMAILLIVVSAFTVQADPVRSNVVETLSDPIREILQQEMTLIQSAVMDIIPAYAAGDTGEITRIAKSIQDSYILNQRLSNQQHHELHEKLPPDFILLDKKVHYYAGMIGEAAQQRKYEQIGFYLSRLTESCSECHNRYARHRFPIFAEQHESRF
ncbi:MAG: hypothetical protein KDI01_05250 [Halioglobus sp.]|nr:hypothetical protein [Halioglobus sp.]